jgi:hypothetical protein
MGSRHPHVRGVHIVVPTMSEQQTGDLESGAGDFSTLEEAEIYWRDRYDWLLEHGYRLRPRYQPDWVPSWKKETDLFASLQEDSYMVPVSLFSLYRLKCFCLKDSY